MTTGEKNWIVFYREKEEKQQLIVFVHEKPEQLKLRSRWHLPCRLRAMKNKLKYLIKSIVSSELSTVLQLLLDLSPAASSSILVSLTRNVWWGWTARPLLLPCDSSSAAGQHSEPSPRAAGMLHPSVVYLSLLLFYTPPSVASPLSCLLSLSPTLQFVALPPPPPSFLSVAFISIKSSFY